jgi:Mg-chelatase subunit ChlD
VGTARVSASVYDRWCRLAVDYQSAAEERDIVALRSGSADERLVGHAVSITRATRRHPELRRGSSVRGAIDIVCIVEALLTMGHAGSDYGTCLLDAACLGLSARIAIDETSRRPPEAIIKELWEDVFILAEHRAERGIYQVSIDNAVALPREAETITLPGLKPLSRKPKALGGAPTLYQTGGSAPVVIQIETVGRGTDVDLAAIGAVEKAQGSIITNEKADLRPLDEILEETPRTMVDPEVRRMADRIARRLSIRHRPRDRNATRGFGNLESVPYRYGSDDIDLDRTIEILAERPAPEDTDIIVRERVGSRRAVALLVDVSGSMRGEKVKIVAATVAALAADLVDDELALVAFWKDAALLKPLHGVKSADRMLEELTRIPAKGLTNVHFALSVGLAELARSPARQRICVLLSDSVHNAGPDPRLLAPRFGRLHVLLQTDGEHDAALAGDLARLGHGLLAPVRDHREVAPAINRLLST